MFELRETAAFADWLRSLQDLQGRVAILRRLGRLAAGHMGDAKPVGDGVSELRVHQGPGYRVYFARRGRTVILLLCGGDKDSQARDIVRAKAMVKEVGND